MDSEVKSGTPSTYPDGPIVDVQWPGEPRAKERPRGRNFYTPTKTRKAERDIGWILRQACDDNAEVPTSLPVEVNISFRLKSGARRDIDNMIKLCLDAANGIVWLDDSQVVKLVVALERGASEASTTFTVWIDSE